MDAIKRDERGNIGIYFLGGLFVFCLMIATVYWALAGEIMHIRQVGLDDMEHAGTDVLYQATEFDPSTNQYVITWPVANLEQLFNQKMAEQGFTKYTITKFEVMHKGDLDIMGHPFAQPGLYIQLALPMDGHEVPIGQDFVLPPYNNATGQYPK